MYGYYREKLHINHLWEVKDSDFSNESYHTMNYYTCIFQYFKFRINSQFFNPVTTKQFFVVKE